MIECDGSGPISIYNQDRKKKSLLQLLAMRRDKRYRQGMIQCAVSFDIINNREYGILKGQIDRGERCKLFFNI